MVYRIKVIIIGEAGVGKTSLVKKFVSGHFTKDYRASIGTNMFIKKLDLNSDKKVSIQIWDIAGQEKWIKMRHLYYRGTHGALIVGDLSRRNTFEQIVHFWSPDMKKYCAEVPIILLANKSDLNSDISKNDVEIVGKRINAKLIFHTSAMNGENVEKSFEMIAKYALKII